MILWGRKRNPRLKKIPALTSESGIFQYLEGPWPSTSDVGDTAPLIQEMYLEHSEERRLTDRVAEKLENGDLPAEQLQKLANTIWLRNHVKWEKLFALYAIEYDPIVNYDRTETRESTRTPDLTQESTRTPDLTRDETRTPNLTRTGELTPHEQVTTTNTTEPGYKDVTEETPATVKETETGRTEAYRKQTDKEEASYTETETYNGYKETETTPQMIAEKEIPGVHVGENHTKKTTGTDKTQTVNDNLKVEHSLQAFNATSMTPSEQDVTTGGSTDTRTPDLTETDTEETHLDQLANSHRQAESGANVKVMEYQEGVKTISGGKTTQHTVNKDPSEVETYTPTADATKTTTTTPTAPGTGSKTHTPTTEGKTVEETAIIAPEKSEEHETGTDKTVTKDTGTDTTVTKDTGTETTSETITAKGNIGVTTSQQMIESEISLWSNFEFWNIVFSDIDAVLCQKVY